MFGHQDDPAAPMNDNQPVTPVDEPAHDAVLAADDLGVSDASVSGAPALDAADAPAPSLNLPTVDTSSVGGDYIATTAPGQPADEPIVTKADESPTNGDLLSIKQQALQQLSPLVGHLEQSPEEKFRTTMMMIQASDNQDLIKAAYEAAQQIGDEKTRAQALLDIVNEINYFTQHNS